MIAIVQKVSIDAHIVESGVMVCTIVGKGKGTKVEKTGVISMKIEISININANITGKETEADLEVVIPRTNN